MHQQKTLSTGKQVNIRPQTWEEFWAWTESASDIEIAIGKLIKDGEMSDAEMKREMMARTKKQRDSLLATCVLEWGQMQFLLPEVLEMERIIKELNSPEIKQGNSAPSVVTTPEENTSTAAAA